MNRKVTGLAVERTFQWAFWGCELLVLFGLLLRSSLLGLLNWLIDFEKSRQCLNILLLVELTLWLNDSNYLRVRSFSEHGSRRTHAFR